MNTKFTIAELAEWIDAIKEAAKDDNSFSIAWFKGTEHEPFAIIAGWMEQFSDNSEVDDMFCVSASNPGYCMCIKIAVNEGPYAYTDYEIMNMPVYDDDSEVDDTEIMLEWEDDPEELAEFFMHEWERIMDTYGEED